ADLPYRNQPRHQRALALNSFSTNMDAAEELRCVDRDVLEDIDSAFILKEEQRNAIKAFVDRKYVFAVLSTGFGKNCIHQLAPMTTTLIQLSEEAFFSWFG